MKGNSTGLPHEVADAKRKIAEEFASLHRDLDAYIEILEKAIEAQFDMAQRLEIRRLLTTARTSERASAMLLVERRQTMDEAATPRSVAEREKWKCTGWVETYLR